MHTRETPEGRNAQSSSSQSRPQASAAASQAQREHARPQSQPSAKPVAAQTSSSSGGRPNLLLPLLMVLVAFLGIGGMGNGCHATSVSDGGTMFDTSSIFETGTTGNAGNAGGYSGLGGLFGQDTYGTGQAAPQGYQIDSNLGAGDASKTWTVLMYLCGSDLESTSVRMGGGQATGNLVEITKANLGDNVNFVVETGGAKAWQNNVISPRHLGRYTIEGGKLALREQLPSAAMAKSDTFADFLSWGVSNFPADHYMVVVWDHGGGSLTGVCQDDLYPNDGRGNSDSLTLVEMNEALQKVGKTFDVIGFDTCLMATLETAQVLAPYAKYMIASEESEPGSGWDYTSWVNWLASHPGTDGADLGQIICQTYYNKCARYRQSGMATLSVIDLSKVGNVGSAFENASDDIARATIDPTSLRRLQQGARSAESFGDSGFTTFNMVDLADLMNKTGSVVGQDARSVVSAVKDAVVYEVHGRNRASASGLSVFYPRRASSRAEFNRYAEIANITNNIPYLQFLAVVYGVYDNYQWNKFDNFVPLHGEVVEEKNVNIRYTQTKDSNGHLKLQITKGTELVGNVEFEMYVSLDQLGVLCFLGSDNDLNGSYETGTFTDNFQDDWLTIDGHYVSATLAEVGDGYNLYYIPIKLNGEQTGLIVEYDFSTNEYSALCVWDDANEVTGMAAKTGPLLQEGDEIQFLFPAMNAKTQINQTIPLETMTWHEDALITYEGLGDGTFAFRYVITDVLGNETKTDLVYQRYQNGQAVR